jgi:hypothetical protein
VNLGQIIGLAHTLSLLARGRGGEEVIAEIRDWQVPAFDRAGAAVWTVGILLAIASISVFLVDLDRAISITGAAQNAEAVR